MDGVRPDRPPPPPLASPQPAVLPRAHHPTLVLVCRHVLPQGIVTSIALEMLRSGKVEGVVCVQVRHKGKPRRRDRDARKGPARRGSCFCTREYATLGEPGVAGSQTRDIRLTICSLLLFSAGPRRQSSRSQAHPRHHAGADHGFQGSEAFSLAESQRPGRGTPVLSIWTACLPAYLRVCARIQFRPCLLLLAGVCARCAPPHSFRSVSNIPNHPAPD